VRAKTSVPSAHDRATSGELVVVVTLLFILVAAAILTGDPVLVASVILTPLYLVQALFTLGAALESPSRLDRPEDGNRTWPSYTVLVPLYREEAVVEALIGALQGLEYPADKLQVIFLLEADDAETAHALKKAGMPAGFEWLVVPPGGPRTKPNALNHGLARASGDFLTVYDAEDVPDPEQLKDSVRLFDGARPNAVCLQAHLVIDNVADSWLALMMAIEYAALFDATKSGFAAMSLPVTLGGTSNHFRTSTLRDVGGWDAWNVAEDAEMGLRLARSGGMVIDLPSDTREEAPCGIGSWFSQRRRWHKGYIQTMVSHGRHTGQALKATGLFGWLGGVVQVAGTLLGALFFPIFAAHMVWLASNGTLFDSPDGWSILRNTLALWGASCGVIVMLVPAIIGLRRRRAWHLAPWLLTMPFYQLLVSAAAWVSIIDYIRAPSHWLKTEHGKGVRPVFSFRSRPGKPS
jgi:glycosyltransferase XagB